MVVRIDGGRFSERKPVPKNTSEPAPAPEQRLILDGRKPPLFFHGVTIPEATAKDITWQKKFDKYARSKKSKKCAVMLRDAIKKNHFWCIAHALETRHQDPDPDSVFTFNNSLGIKCVAKHGFWVSQEEKLNEYITSPFISLDVKEMMINGLYPANETVVDFETLAGFQRHTLMSWAEQANQDVLNAIFLATICAGHIDDIVKLSEMGADLNGTGGQPPEHCLTPLRCAVSRQDNMILKQVIDLGANIFADYNDLIELACQYGDVDIIKTIKETHSAKEKAAGLQPQTENGGWTALSKTFAEFSRPQSPDGSQLKYQIDFETRLVNMLYKQGNQIIPGAVITFVQLDNPELLKTAADMIENSGYARPDTGRYLNHSPGARTITSLSHNKLGR